jgi:hypothetical protein
VIVLKKSPLDLLVDGTMTRRIRPQRRGYVIYFRRDDFLATDLEAFTSLLVAFFGVALRATAFFTDLATFFTVGFSEVMPRAPATVPIVAPMPLATVTKAPPGDSGTFFFCAM